jgi:hypothetical protein
MSATTKQRHTASHRCPVWRGADADPRQTGQRCHGFTDGVWVYCSRPEFAGKLEACGNGDLYRHWVGGACNCGVAHAGSTANGAGAPSGRKSRISAIYDYRDEHGHLLYQVLRKEPKSFLQRRPATEADFRTGDPKPNQDKDGAWWVWKVPDDLCVLYRLDQLAAASRDVLVWLVEGERDVNSLTALGLISTCNPKGALNWHPRYNTSLQGRKVIVVADNDDIGRQHAEQVAASVRAVSAGVKILALPGLAEHQDVSDWLLMSGNTRAKLEELASQAPEWAPAREAPRAEPARPAWPTLAPEALYGLAGDLVRAIDEHTEADLAAVLVNILGFFGNAAGRTPHARVGSTRHGMNEYIGIVGQTSKSRKGSSTGVTRDLFGRLDPDWAADHITSGLSSGEGLIEAVRDPSTKCDKEGMPLDAGVTDKRLLVIEEELASVFTVTARQGNTLSARLREAWDGGTLATKTRNPLKATGAHIRLLGHITVGELQRQLSEEHIVNGLANRFVWICARRSKLLPEGGGDFSYGELVKRLHDALEFARTLDKTIERDEAARAAWEKVYGPLSAGKPGLFGTIVSRGEAHVLRISSIFAALDLSPVVRLEHLRAALALWDYAEASAKFIFGSRLGDPIADAILEGLRTAAEQGLDRTAISNLFGRNVPASRIHTALSQLEEANLIVGTLEQTGGAPRKVYRRVE